MLLIWYVWFMLNFCFFPLDSVLGKSFAAWGEVAFLQTGCVRISDRCPGCSLLGECNFWVHRPSNWSEFTPFICVQVSFCSRVCISLPSLRVRVSVLWGRGWISLQLFAEVADFSQHYDFDSLVSVTPGSVDCLQHSYEAHLWVPRVWQMTPAVCREAGTRGYSLWVPGWPLRPALEMFLCR